MRKYLYIVSLFSYITLIHASAKDDSPLLEIRSIAFMYGGETHVVFRDENDQKIKNDQEKSVLPNANQPKVDPAQPIVLASAAKKVARNGPIFNNKTGQVLVPYSFYKKR